jgi:1,4-dihydroxy-2-naphthoyl-CoA synthase
VKKLEQKLNLNAIKLEVPEVFNRKIEDNGLEENIKNDINFIREKYTNTMEAMEIILANAVIELNTIEDSKKARLMEVAATSATAISNLGMNFHHKQTHMNKIRIKR